jgi:hypothetical protein
MKLLVDLTISHFIITEFYYYSLNFRAPAHAGSSLADFLIFSSTLKMKAIHSSGTSVNFSTCSRWFLARRFSSFFFYPEDGGDTFLRNIG